MDIINIVLVIVSVGFGAVGLLAPARTMAILDLHKGPTSMGPSEMRAASGGLFIGLGLGALWLGTPVAFAMIGCAWGGAAVGRLVSLVADGFTPKKAGFFAAEVAVAALALWNNLGGPG